MRMPILSSLAALSLFLSITLGPPLAAELSDYPLTRDERVLLATDELDGSHDSRS